MCQDTPLTIKGPDIFSLVFFPERVGNGLLYQKNPYLLKQFYRKDHSMRTKQPITHNLVESAAFFVLLGNVPDAGLLQTNSSSQAMFRVFCLDYERTMEYEYRKY